MRVRVAESVSKEMPNLSIDDIITSREETRAGFISMALEKNLIATQFVQEARALRALAEQAEMPADLLNMPSVRKGLLAASGLSDKALKFLNEDDETEAIRDLIATFLEPAGESFAEELVYRFLLTKGDALGGKARNLAGTIGDRRFLQCLVAVLSLGGIEYSWRDRKTKQWIGGPIDEIYIEKSLDALHWRVKERDRILLMNTKVPLIDKNVDLVVMNAIPENWKKGDRSLLIQNSRYVALGELKGGVDPAGADEHWKTADTALTRVRKDFQGQRLGPPTFFIGAAVERGMATEIVDQMNKGVLSKVANLTKDEQLVGLCEWLIGL